MIINQNVKVVLLTVKENYVSHQKAFVNKQKKYSVVITLVKLVIVMNKTTTNVQLVIVTIIELYIKHLAHQMMDFMTTE